MNWAALLLGFLCIHSVAAKSLEHLWDEYTVSARTPITQTRNVLAAAQRTEIISRLKQKEELKLEGDLCKAVETACMHGPVVLLQHLHDNQEFDILACRFEGFTPLQLASKHSEPEVVEYLLSLGSDPHERSPPVLFGFVNGMSAFEYANTPSVEAVFEKHFAAKNPKTDL
eukprot:m.16145 g.16145  ORF g.16145 m.16145 type:complete len:171 (-) comp6820_c0_seq1:371-883(-)